MIGLLALLLGKQRHLRSLANGMGSRSGGQRGDCWAGRRLQLPVCLFTQLEPPARICFTSLHSVFLFICFFKAFGCIYFVFSAGGLGSVPVCLFPQLQEVPVPYCRPHKQGLTQKGLSQPGYQLVSAILDKSKESSRQNGPSEGN